MFIHHVFTTGCANRGLALASACLPVNTPKGPQGPGPALARTVALRALAQWRDRFPQIVCTAAHCLPAMAPPGSHAPPRCWNILT